MATAPRSISGVTKLGLVVGGILLSLVALEVGLRVVGASRVRTHQSKQSKNLQRRIENSDVRVLCIGESTTHWGYPRQLAQVFAEDESTRVAVFNGGLAAASSVDLVGGLEAQLDRFDPHVVVAMMGINDHRVEYAERFPIVRALRNSRVYRLYALIWEHLNADEPLRDRDGDLVEAEMPMLKQVTAMLGAGDVDGGRALLLQALEMPEPTDDERSQLAMTAVNVAAALRRGGRIDEALAVARLGAEVSVPRSVRRAAVYSFISRVYEREGDEERAAKARAQALEAQFLPLDLDVTRESYERMRALLAERGIPLIAVQYPMRDVAQLRAMHGDPSDLTFVDNRADFEAAVAEKGFSAIFKDQFAGDFGHMRAPGKRVLARNVAEAIRRDISSGRISPSARPDAAPVKPAGGD